MTAEELKIIFENPYNQSDWLKVLKEVLGIKNILIRPQEIDTINNEWDAKGFELGNFETVEGRLVGVYEVQIGENIKLERNKVGLRNLLKPIYNNDVDAALVVFNQGSQWRFSYVSEIRIKNKETGKREKKTTDPKRYTYLFGRGRKCRTAAERFAKIYQHYNLFGGAVKLEEIENAFSVESLTKLFYRELSDWYFRALKEVQFPDDADRALNPEPTEESRDKEERTRNATHTIRLITRLIFVWFLKQKGLVPDELFDKKEVDELINYKDKTGSTYYKAILQNLFFATLNTEMGDENRKFIERQSGVQTFYRYKRFFKKTDRFLELTKNIPFLNGGLFENLDKNIEDTEEDNKIRIDCFSNALKNEERLTFSDSLFFNDEVVDLSADYGDKKKKNQKVRGLINILQSYNFTIEENTPFEVEVALDPELLGKVFENLLASYNPETETTARKMTGSFYTPREIVDYMVDESLKAYLANFLTERVDDKLNQLFSNTTEISLLNEKEKQALIYALDEVKILDPACGSGAFPMGVLQKMVLILTKLDPENEKWKDIQRQKAIKETEEAFRLGNKTDRDERLKDISEAFEDNSDDYGRKLYLIENGIYGVDIQPIAVQISKLRFFISLVCDQEVNNKRKNRGVRPLPNLETKFVAANTLSGLKKQLLLRNPKIEELEVELNDVRHKHFSARTTATKRKWRDRDRELREQIGHLLKYDGWDNTTAELVANWNPYEQNTFSLFFDKEWMFGIIEGFDVVIGNPPYKQITKGLYNKDLFPYSEGKDQGKQNLYKLFVEQSYNLSKDGSFVTLIVQSSLMGDLSSTFSRELLIDKTAIVKFLEFPKRASENDSQVFDSVLQGTCIYLTEKIIPKENHKFLISTNNNTKTILNPEFETIQQSIIKKLYPSTFYIPLIKKGDFGVMQKILKQSEPFKNIMISIRQGDLNLTASKDYFSTVESDVKLFRGKNIGRYYLNKKTEEYIIPGFMEERVIANRKNIFIVGQEVTGTTDWRRLHFCKTDRIDNYLFGHTANKILIKDQSQSNFILAILNSKLLDWYFRKTSTNNHVMGYELEQLPITNSKNSNLSKLSQCIQEVKSASIPDSSIIAFFENLIDACIYELYFPEEVESANCEVLKYLRELPDIETCSSHQSRLNMIVEFYNEHNDNSHPLKVALFNLDTINEISIIEGKKK